MQTSQARILLVEDEKDIAEFLEYNLSKEGYTIEVAHNGEEGLKKVDSYEPDLILLDIMMPVMDGIEMCEKLRSNPDNKDIVVAFLSARSESFTQISALDMGGDDYIQKPIKPNLLKSRIRALLRRAPRLSVQKQSHQLHYGDVVIDTDSLQVFLNGDAIKVAKKEFELLSLLTSKPGKVFTRAEILSKVWGKEVIVGDRTIDVHIRKLREKLGSKYIVTFKGVGYKFIA